LVAVLSGLFGGTPTARTKRGRLGHVYPRNAVTEPASQSGLRSRVQHDRRFAAAGNAVHTDKTRSRRPKPSQQLQNLRVSTKQRRTTRDLRDVPRVELEARQRFSDEHWPGTILRCDGKHNNGFTPVFRVDNHGRAHILEQRIQGAHKISRSIRQRDFSQQGTAKRGNLDTAFVSNTNTSISWITGGTETNQHYRFSDFVRITVLTRMTTR
jgi:hypothetical protein